MQTELARDGSDRVVRRRPSPYSAALADIVEGASKSWMWTAFAIQDIKLRYRGSILGPFWLTISTLVMVSSMGVIYARLFNMPASQYLPYLMVGLILWQFISAVISEGCSTFLSVDNIIQQVPMPFSIHVFRTVFRNIIVLAHNAVIIPLGLLILGVPIGWRALELIPALCLYAVNGFWIGLLLGMLSARFRDVPPIIANIVQVLFFVTPIIWHVESLGDLRVIGDVNPAFAAIDVVRAPLLGVSTNVYSWPVFLAFTLFGCWGTFVIFARFRARIAYWI
jgi:homopolymeric O-antigen transport system permease protein